MERELSITSNTTDMGKSKEQFQDLQQMACIMDDDDPTPGQMCRLIDIEPVIIPAFIPYIEKHATMLDHRNMYADLCKYSAALVKVSRGNKPFWEEAYERQSDQLRFIENRLLEVESAMS